jgi:hypothetical protein
MLGFEFESRLALQLELLPYTTANITALERAAKLRGFIGGTAAGILFKLTPDRHLDLIEEMLTDPEDWNYQQNFIKISKSHWSETAFLKLDRHDQNEILFLDLVLCDESTFSDVVAKALANIEQLDERSLSALGHMDFWMTASTSTIMDTLCSRNAPLAGGVLSKLQIRTISSGQVQELPLLATRTLDWWLEWQEECLSSSADSEVWCGWRIGELLKSNSQRKPWQFSMTRP